MLPHEDSPPGKCRGKFQQKFLHAFGLMVLVWLFFYVFTQTDMKFKADDQLEESWSMSMFVHTAFSKLKTNIMIPKTQKNRKLVLLWNSYFDLTSDWLPSTKDLQCPVSNCDATSNRDFLDQSSAIIFHWRNTDVHDLPKCTPSENVQCPLWILFNLEAPPHTPRKVLEQIQDKVHWTVTYRKDSDVYAPYGKVIPRKDSFTTHDFEPNRRLVCWLVSNCNTPSHREIFVNELKKYIEVDIYGKCGSEQCPHQKAKDCYNWLSKKCKFYLSLENSNCRDYTTEKLYNALSSGMIPIVHGNSSNYIHLPPRSYINTADFSSPKELAEYLVTVGSDKSLFLSYFWWRKHHEAIDFEYKWFCDLCEKLHNTDIRKVKPRNNLISWWFDQSGCAS